MSVRLTTTRAALLTGAGSALRIFGGRGWDVPRLCAMDDAAAFALDCATLHRDYLDAVQQLSGSAPRSDGQEPRSCS